MQSPCCARWVECSECHDETSNHLFQHSSKIKFMCKNCKKCFFRDFKLFSASDKLCNYCRICWVIPAETPESKIVQETTIVLDSFLEEVLDPSQQFFNEL